MSFKFLDYDGLIEGSSKRRCRSGTKRKALGGKQNNLAYEAGGAAASYFPVRLPQSIIGAERLHCHTWDGNGCFP